MLVSLSASQQRKSEHQRQNKAKGCRLSLSFSPFLLLLLFSILAHLSLADNSLRGGVHLAPTEDLAASRRTDLLHQEVDVLCSTDGDCGSAQQCINNICQAETLSLHSPRSLIGALCVAIAIMLASAGGIGGGGLLIPIFCLVVGLRPQEAVPLSKATIFGSAVANLILGYKRRHPVDRSRPLIDYEVAMIMEPMTLAGTIAGVYLNRVFPNWIIVSLLVLLLAFTARKTYRNGQKVWKREHDRDRKRQEEVITFWTLLLRIKTEPQLELAYRVQRQWREAVQRKRQTAKVREIQSFWKKEVAPSPEERLEKGKKIIHQGLTFEVQVVEKREEKVKEQVPRPALAASEDADGDEENNSLLPGKSKGYAAPFMTIEGLKKQRSKVPLADIALLFLVWAALLVHALLKGGHGAPSVVGLTCGTFPYWFTVFLAFPVLFLFTMWYGRKLVKRHQTLQLMGWEYLQGDVVWNYESALKYPLLCMFAGVAAGMLGIGGGMIKGPLLLDMGILPEVSAATCSFMILFTSSATTVQFAIMGMLRADYATFFCLLGFFSSLVGQVGVGYAIRKYRKTAIIVFLIAFVVGFSCVIMGVTGVYKMLVYGLQGFSSVCGVDA